MKKIGLLALLIFFGAAFGMAAEKNKAKISFETTVHDFGNIKEAGGPVTYEFKFTNIGKAPLKITSARAECGCTKPEYPKKEIAPGETGIIKVTYNPLGRPGGFTKVVTVRCSGNPGKVNLKIRGSVVPQNSYSAGNLSFESTVANFGDMERGVKRKRQISFYNTGQTPVSPVFSCDSEALSLQLSPTEILPGDRGVLTIYLDSSKVVWLGSREMKIFGNWGSDKGKDTGKVKNQKTSHDIVIDVKAVVVPRTQQSA